ncbi:MAG TPA: hypothetical protein VJQ47_18950 [Steroidobacteraceae bacterium]|nr:hypothetical protein [Steroidobacteraceae bacterium]
MSVDFQAYGSSGRDRYFSVMKPEDEYLHRPPSGARCNFTETNMFGFNIPGEGIDCLIYFWHHAVLGTTTGGIMCWQGVKRHHMECEAFDYQNYMPLPADSMDASYPCNVTVKMLKPLEAFHVTYQNASLGNRLDLHLQAAMPPACRYNGGHITQAMKTSGELVLRGKRYEIDGFHSRDHSWGEHRSEALQDIPPLSWLVGVVDESFAFHCLAFDSRRHHPEWGMLYPGIDDRNNVLWGYVRDDGETHGIIGADQRTHRGPDGVTPVGVDLILRASNGKSYEIAGRHAAMTPLAPWPNMHAHFVLMKWEYANRTGWGDVQEVIYGEAFRRLIRR